MKIKFALILISLSAALTAAADPLTARIINGTPAASGAWPWMASLHESGYDAADPRHGHFCGGSLIHPQYVLSAAHCMKDVASRPDLLMVTIGRTRLSDRTSGVTVPVESVLVHPAYNSTTQENDLALVKLRAAADGVTPVAIDFAGQAAVGGADATIIGWGVVTPSGTTVSDTLQQAIIPVHSDAECAANLGTGFSAAAMICAVTLASSLSAGDGVDACFGDSGGPLLVTDAAGVVRQAGITSWGYACASSRYYGAWTRVSAFAVWLAQHIPLPPVVHTAPTVTGSPIVGQVLMCHAGSTDGIGITTDYIWEDSSGTKLNSLNASAYVPRQADAGKTLRCTLVARNSAGSATASSPWIGPVSNTAASAQDKTSPRVRAVRVKCRQGQCTMGISARDPGRTASGVAAIILQSGLWSSKTCIRVNRVRSCTPVSEQISFTETGQDARYYYYRFSVPKRGRLTFQVQVSDRSGNMSALRSFRFVVS